ncbi:MAG: response regulator [Polyangiales bacterium]
MAGSSHERMARPRILVIDDEEISGHMLAGLLEEGGFAVTRLSSPLGATRAALRQDFAAVVVDLNMPAMTGDRLVQLFRSNERLRDLPVVLVSGEPPERLREISDELGNVTPVTKRRVQIELVPAVRALQLEGAGSDTG